VKGYPHPVALALLLITLAVLSIIDGRRINDMQERLDHLEQQVYEGEAP
jgi:hypothetical protein